MGTNYFIPSLNNENNINNFVDLAKISSFFRNKTDGEIYDAMVTPLSAVKFLHWQNEDIR